MKRGCEVVVSYLPLAHIAGQCTDLYLAMAIGATIYFADKNALKGTLVNTLKVARPTLFAGEKIVRSVCLQILKIFEYFQAFHESMKNSKRK